MAWANRKDLLTRSLFASHRSRVDQARKVELALRTASGAPLRLAGSASRCAECTADSINWLGWEVGLTYGDSTRLFLMPSVAEPSHEDIQSTQPSPVDKQPAEPRLRTEEEEYLRQVGTPSSTFARSREFGALTNISCQQGPGQAHKSREARCTK